MSQILKSRDFMKTEKSWYLGNETSFFFKQKDSLITHQALLYDVAEVTFKFIFLKLTENSSVVTNDTQRPQKYLQNWKYLQERTTMRKIALQLPWYFYLLMEKPLGCYFQVWYLCYLAALCSQEIPTPVSSTWQVRSEKKDKHQH